MKLTRRSALQAPLAALVPQTPRLDRKKIVDRHDPQIKKLDEFAPLSVGNGEFAFTADVTGLQTLPEAYQKGIPLGTQAQWGWHATPAPAGLDAASYRMSMYESHGRQVPYPTSSTGQKAVYDWLRENPHRLHLGMLGLAADPPLQASEISAIDQRLDLWTGTLHSKFVARGAEVRVTTACHPSRDAVAVRVESELLQAGRLWVRLRFPYGSPSVEAVDWTKPQAHETKLEAGRIHRKLDETRYEVALAGAPASQAGPHEIEFRTQAPRLEVCCEFRRTPGAPAPPVAEVFAASARHWPGFWGSGGAVDFSGSADPRAHELERRVVLSQYLTAIQCAGSLPPQETGLTCNSWYGKFHLEMHWWHAAHFAFWGRTPLLERSLGYYTAILPKAQAWARQQGYSGARWPKMTDPRGLDSPSPIGPLLIWQQPHPIYYAELCYRARPTRATAEKYRDLVFETAEFMAGFAHWNAAKGWFELGPPVIPAQENHPAKETWNPTWELEYWRWALEVAQLWRKRLGLAAQPEWARVAEKLAPLPEKDGVYLAHENCPQTYTERQKDHPSMLGALGFLPGKKANPETMRRTLKKVMAVWSWPDTWGWDYPLVAMTAARLGEAQIAVDALLMETAKNRYLPNGHNYQRPALHLYLPGNGGLLAAIAILCAGWEGRPKGAAPIFPKGWNVQWEGLQPML